MNTRNNIISLFLITLGITLIIQPLTATKADDENIIINQEETIKPKRLNINIANCLQQRLRSRFS